MEINTTMDVSVVVRNFVVDNFLFGDDSGLTRSTSFRDEGVLDSTGVLELVSFLERTYGIEIEDEEVVPANLDSLQNIERFVSEKDNQHDH
jgi:acyl carrier protein